MNAENHWQLLKSGNRSSFEWLYRTYVDQLLRYGYAFSKDHVLVEDCLQDLFVLLWEKRLSLGETTSVKNYLFASFRRSIWKKLKKEQQTKTLEENDSVFFAMELNIEDKTIAQERDSENVRKLKTAMESLSSRQKELLYLKYETGMTYEEICELMDIHYQSARNLLSSAIRKLRKEMAVIMLLIFLLI